MKFTKNHLLSFTDTVRELLTHVPASVKSEQPTNPNYAIDRSLATESNLTALHLAAFSGSENVVRTLLNSSGVDVEGACSPAVSISSAHCGNFRIFLSFELYLKSVLKNLEVLKLPFLGHFRGSEFC